MMRALLIWNATVHRLPDDFLLTLFEAGHERRDLEFKDAFSWTSDLGIYLQEVTIKGVLGMTNSRGGGLIVVGVAEDDDRALDFKGLTDEQLQSFQNFDGIKGRIDAYSTAPLDYDVSHGTFRQGNYVVISVREFKESPAMCKKNGKINNILVKDEVYTRSLKGQPATIRMGDLEFREIIQMAADKENENLISRGWSRASSQSIEQFYEDQLGELR